MSGQHCAGGTTPLRTYVPNSHMFGVPWIRGTFLDPRISRKRDSPHCREGLMRSSKRQEEKNIG